MDSDLLADILNDGQPALPGNLLSHLPERTLTLDEFNVQTTASTSGSSSGTVNHSQAGAVVSKIEDIFERVADCILDEKKEVAIKLRTRAKQSAMVMDSTTGTIKSVPDDETRTVKFPSKSPKEAWKFSKWWKSLGVMFTDLKQLPCSGFSNSPTKLWLRALLPPKGFASIQIQS